MKTLLLIVGYFILTILSLQLTSDTSIQGLINEEVTIASGVTVTANAIHVNGAVSVYGRLLFSTSTIPSNITGNMIIGSGGSMNINETELFVFGSVNASASDSIDIKAGGFVIQQTTKSEFNRLTLETSTMIFSHGKIKNLVYINKDSLIRIFGTPLEIEECTVIYNPSEIQAPIALDNLDQKVYINKLSINHCEIPNGKMILVFGVLPLPDNKNLTLKEEIKFYADDTKCIYEFGYELLLDNGNFVITYIGRCPDYTITIVGISVVGAAVIAVVIIVFAYISKRDKKRKQELAQLQAMQKMKQSDTEGNQGSQDFGVNLVKN